MFSMGEEQFCEVCDEFGHCISELHPCACGFEHSGNALSDCKMFLMYGSTPPYCGVCKMYGHDASVPHDPYCGFCGKIHADENIANYDSDSNSDDENLISCNPRIHPCCGAVSYTKQTSSEECIFCCKYNFDKKNTFEDGPELFEQPHISIDSSDDGFSQIGENSDANSDITSDSDV